MTAHTSANWSAPSRLLHWLTALLILAMAVIGLTMDSIARSQGPGIYTLHKSLGITVLVLVIVRLGWRLYAGKPAPLPGIPRWQGWLADGMHGLLYLLLLTMPLSGWLMDSAGTPRPWKVFGWFELPAISGRSAELAETANQIHVTGFWVLAAMTALHVAAALYHHLFLGDATLSRMLHSRRRHLH